ncbi:MAG: alpha/beta fold hydrolase [Deltaproteobacteria bacterium]
MSAPRHSFIDAQGLRIHCLEWGHFDGEPLILVHGYLDLADSWRAFVAALETGQPNFRVIAPDCRGHGDSGWIGAGGYYHFPDYVFDLDCVVRAHSLDSFTLIGHSMGGTISLLYAGTFPERVKKLVLIEGIGPVGMTFSEAPLKMEKWITELHERGRRHFREYTSLAAGASQLRQTNPRLSENTALEIARAAMKQNDRGKGIWKFDPLHRTTAPQPFYTAQALEFLRRIQCPVLLIDGEQSRQTRRTDKQERYEAIANHQRVTINGAGHMVHQDNPDQLADVVRDFISR